MTVKTASMLEHKTGTVPVFDADGVLIGIVSCVDVRRSLPFEDNAAE